MSVDRADALRRALEQPHPEEWRPEQPGDTIVGWFVRLDQASTRFRAVTWIVVLADVDTGVERAVWVVHEALQQKLRKLAPSIGELVGIRYEGVGEPGQGGNAPSRYRVMVDRAAGTRIDWDAAVEASESGEIARPVYLPADAAAAGPEALFEAAPLEEVVGRDSHPAPTASSSGFGDVPAGRQREEPSRRDLPDDGTKSFRCAKCLSPWPHHEAGCPDEFGGM